MTAAPPSEMSAEQLKEVVRPIILAQGNTYIKELLRKHKLPIGGTKAEFRANILAAIDEGTLSQQSIEAWLEEVEGWGNQHVYLYAPPAVATHSLPELIAASEHAALLERPVSYDFPDKLNLSALSVDGSRLSMSWHRGQTGWERAKLKDFQREEDDDDLYEYRAYRLRADRRVVRFEWRFEDEFCAILIQLANEGDTHANAISQVQEDLRAAGVTVGPLQRVNLSRAFKALTRDDAVSTQTARMMTDGGYVELAATVSDGSIAEIEAVREVRQAVDDSQFATADGMFNLKVDDHPKLSRAIKVQGYGADSRLRLWVQCKREDVFEVLELVWAHNAP